MMSPSTPQMAIGTKNISNDNCNIIDKDGDGNGDNII